MTRWLVTISCGIVQTLPPEIGVAGISWSKNLDCRLLRFLQNTCTQTTTTTKELANLQALGDGDRKKKKTQAAKTKS